MTVCRYFAVSLQRILPRETQDQLSAPTRQHRWGDEEAAPALSGQQTGQGRQQDPVGRFPLRSPSWRWSAASWCRSTSSSTSMAVLPSSRRPAGSGDPRVTRKVHDHRMDLDHVPVHHRPAAKRPDQGPELEFSRGTGTLCWPDATGPRPLPFGSPECGAGEPPVVRPLAWRHDGDEGSLYRHPQAFPPFVPGVCRERRLVWPRGRCSGAVFAGMSELGSLPRRSACMLPTQAHILGGGRVSPSDR